MINLNLESRKTPQNILNKNRIEYSPYAERVNNVLFYLNKMLSKKFTEFLNFPIFFLGHYSYSTFKGVEIEKIYTIDYFENFMGNIPLENQEQIIKNLEILKSNPFIELIKVSGYSRPQLFVLAPKNNFATEHNESAIDPIVFAQCLIQNQEYLIPITQWS